MINSHVPTIKALARINVTVEQFIWAITNQPTTLYKRGRPVGSKDIIPRKRKTNNQTYIDHDDCKMNEKFIISNIPLEEVIILEETQAPKMT